MNTRLVTWRGTAPPQTLAVFPEDQVKIRVHGSLNPTGISVGPIGGAAFLGDSIVVIVDGQKSMATVLRFTESGLDTARATALPGEARPITPRERDRLEKRVEEQFRNLDGVTEPRFPEQWPAWSGVQATESGAVWLRRGGQSEADPEYQERWVRWSADATHFDEIRLPMTIRAVRWGAGYLVAKRVDEYGVEYLRLYRINDVRS